MRDRRGLCPHFAERPLYLLLVKLDASVLGGALYDERFCRMWEFYLACSEASFRVESSMVFQLLLVKDRTALPQTRSYMEAG